MKQHPIFVTYFATADERIYNEKTRRYIKGAKRFRGKYKDLKLPIDPYLDGKKAATVCFSRFVIECFNNCVLTDGVDIIHKNGDKFDNSIKNLKPFVWYFSFESNMYKRVVC